uniref:Transmembrane protein n=1 Tax=Populus davidiana TaxID=266767 RepID=A0A6M2EST5_9ROSI
MMQNQTKATTALTTTMIKRKEIMDQPSFLFLWITYSYASFWLSLSSLFSRLLVSNFLSLSSEDPIFCFCQIIPYETTTSPFQKFQIQRAFSGVVFFGFSEVYNEKLYFEKEKKK